MMDRMHPLRDKDLGDLFPFFNAVASPEKDDPEIANDPLIENRDSVRRDSIRNRDTYGIKRPEVGDFFAGVQYHA